MDMSFIDRALKKHPHANVAIALSGLTVIDIDGVGGRKAVKAFNLPKTPKGATGRGSHLYFDGEFPGGMFKATEVDVLVGPNRYVMAPKSIIKLKKAPGARETKPQSKSQPKAIQSGARNDTLFRFASYLRYRGLSEGTVRSLVATMNEKECTLPLQDNELEALLASSSRYEKETLFAPVGDAEVLPLEAIWYPYIMRHGVTIIAGDPGKGKSLLLTLITAIISNGDCWPLSDQRAKKGPVLLLSAEDNFERVTLARLQEAKADISWLHRMEKFRALEPERLEELCDYIREIQPELVIIDTLSAYLGAKRDMNRQNEVGEFLAKLNEIAEETGCVVIALAHLNKQTNEPPLFRIVGSIGIAASVRSALFLGDDPNDRSRLALAHGKANGTPLGPTIAFEMVGGGEGKTPTLVPIETIEADATAVCRIERGDVGRPATKSEEAERFILKILTQGPMSWDKLVRAAEDRNIASPPTLISVRSRLAEQHKLVQVGKARNTQWKLTTPKHKSG